MTALLLSVVGNLWLGGSPGSPGAASHAQLAFVLPDADTVPESIVWDPARRVFLVTLGPDGSVFVSEEVEGRIEVLDPCATTLRRLVAAGTFRGPQGMAVSGDGPLLYASPPLGRSGRMATTSSATAKAPAVVTRREIRSRPD